MWPPRSADNVDLPLGEALGASCESAHGSWRRASIGGIPTAMPILPGTTLKRCGVAGVLRFSTRNLPPKLQRALLSSRQSRNRTGSTGRRGVDCSASDIDEPADAPSRRPMSTCVKPSLRVPAGRPLTGHGSALAQGRTSAMELRERGGLECCFETRVPNPPRQPIACVGVVQNAPTQCAVQEIGAGLVNLVRVLIQQVVNTQR